MGGQVKEGYKRVTIENGVQIEIPVAEKDSMDMAQQQCYQRFIHVLSNIITKYSIEEETKEKG